MMFPFGGSSSAACKDGEMLKISAPEMDRSTKEEVLSNSSVESCGLADEDSDDLATSNDDAAELEGSEDLNGDDDFSSDLYSGEDDWMYTDYDNTILDYNEYFEAHFDNMELPPGVEAPVPWFKSSPKNFKELEDLEDSISDDDFSSTLYLGVHDWMDTDYDNMIFRYNDYLEAHFRNMELTPDVEARVPWFTSSPKNDTKSPSTSTYSGNSPWTRPPARVVDKIVYKYENFLQFDTVEDYSDHHYATKVCPEVAPENWLMRIQGEWEILERDLPDTIYVRAYGSRMDLLRAVMVGAEGTPYHDGLFFFDVYFPSNYPQIPPEVYYHSGGQQIIQLSLLNTSTGRGNGKWIAEESTILQVLVSIQESILKNSKPFFNEPRNEVQMGTNLGEERSSAFNENTFMCSLKAIIYTMQRPPKHFEDFTIGYFRKHARYILVSCAAYLNGAQVGCLVRVGVRDVNTTDKKRCSDQFKKSLREFIPTLVHTFMEIGADGCQDFLAYAKKDRITSGGAMLQSVGGAKHIVLSSSLLFLIFVEARFKYFRKFLHNFSKIVKFSGNQQKLRWE